ATAQLSVFAEAPATAKTDKPLTTDSGATTGQNGPVVSFVSFLQGGDPLPEMMKLLAERAPASLSDFAGGSPSRKTDKTDNTDKPSSRPAAAVEESGPLVRALPAECHGGEACRTLGPCKPHKAGLPCATPPG